MIIDKEERGLITVIKEQTALLFTNMQISIAACNRDRLICGSPAWRYIYHTIHSCDSWFINPAEYIEKNDELKTIADVFPPCNRELSNDELLEYLSEVEEKVNRYLDALNDIDLYEKPEGCDYTRLALILGQFRHFMSHIGINNGVTVADSGKFTVIKGLTDDGGTGLYYDYD